MSGNLDRRGFLKTAAVGIGAGVALARTSTVLGAGVPVAKGKSLAGFKVAPLEVVRIGMIGVGARGPTHMNAYLRMDGCADAH